MANPAIHWPHKDPRAAQSPFRFHHLERFKFRDGDIVIATYGKSGTTWVQQIVSQLIFNGAEDLPVAAMSPWLDCAFRRRR